MSYLTKQQLIDKVNSDFASGKPNKITASDLLGVMVDCADSFANNKDTDSYSVTSKVGESLIASLRQVWPSSTATFHFATISPTSKTIEVKTTTGYVKLIEESGSLGPRLGNGNPNSDIVVTIQEGGGVRAFGVLSVTSIGNTPSGSITYVSSNDIEMVAVDVSGLLNLTDLVLVHGKLTKFDGSNLGYLNILDLGYNYIKDFTCNTSSLTYLSLLMNQMYSFPSLNLNNLATLNLGFNNLKTIDLTNNCASMYNIYLQFNYLTEILGLNSASFQAVNIGGNLLESDDVDDILIAIASTASANGGEFDSTGNIGQPTSASLSARNNMIAGGWTITY